MTTPLKSQGGAEVKSCARERPERQWTLSDYQGLTESLVPRFGIKPLMCANFAALRIDPGERIAQLLEGIETLSQDEPPNIWLRGILGVLIVIYGYVRKISASRLYRWVLKKFVLFTLLMIALEQVMESLIELLEWLILQVEALQLLHQLLACQEKNDV